MSLRQLPGPLIFAHRGASAHAPENTLAAFRLAVGHNADGIELDAKLSADGIVVIMHDQKVDRTTDGTGMVASLTAAQMQRLDAGSHFSEAFSKESVPTLEEVFEAVAKQLYINIELTNYASPMDGLPVQVAHLVKKHNLMDRVMISSFHPMNLIRFHRLLPSVPVGLLTQGGNAGKWARSWVGRIFPQDALHPYYSDVDARLVEQCHRHAKKVNVWTVNSSEEICRLLGLKVDGIITDDPLLARQAFGW